MSLLFHLFILLTATYMCRQDRPYITLIIHIESSPVDDTCKLLLTQDSMNMETNN